MRLFTTRQEFDDILGRTKKWVRTSQAVDAAAGRPPGVAYSLGDSLTYLTDSASALATDHLVGRRRYHLVVAATQGSVSVEVAAANFLDAQAPYDDLTDRQPFTGSAEVVEIPEGGILVVGIDEAARILPATGRTATCVLVTVEGATFHNK